MAEDCAPTRRTVLGLLGATFGAATLAGCGVRWDRRETDLPLLAPRAVDPRAVAVYAELRRVRTALAAANAAVGTAGAGPTAPTGAAGGIAATLAGLHRVQESVLTGRLTELGEDPKDTARLDAALGSSASSAMSRSASAASPSASVATPSSAPAPAASSAGSSSAASPLATQPPPVPVSMAAAEAAGLAADDLGALDRLPPDETPLLLSLRVQRAVALPLVGGSAPTWATPTIATQGEAARLVGLFRAAEYGLRVAAARSAGATRTRLLGPLSWTTAARLILEPQAGEKPMNVPPGYALPFPVTDDASAIGLAQTVLAGLTNGVLSGAPAAAGSTPGLLAVLSLAAVAEGQARDLGAELRAFPGLSSQSTPAGR
ncbi:MAG: hypothetical protein IPK37_00495 [Austwickia sp.]|nr:MAG: hypothetical protein IPK37_00495 [Austwickia sp.]